MPLLQLLLVFSCGRVAVKCSRMWWKCCRVGRCGGVSSPVMQVTLFGALSTRTKLSRLVPAPSGRPWSRVCNMSLREANHSSAYSQEELEIYDLGRVHRVRKSFSSCEVFGTC
jgi:hypothetical protein